MTRRHPLVLPSLVLTLVAGVAASIVLAASPAPVHAARRGDTLSEKCYTYDDGIVSQKVCLDVYWHRDGGPTGIYVSDVTLRITDGEWSNPAVGCNNVRLWNGDDVVKWAKYGADCEIPGSPPYVLFHPHRDMPDATLATVGYTFYPHIADAPDPGREHLSIDLTS